MMIGCDIEQQKRFVRLVNKENFLTRVYTVEEQEYIRRNHNPARAAAGLFCAKEATAKAMGEGFFGLQPRDIEITHEKGGRPAVRLRGKAFERYPEMQFSLSISHASEVSMATCIAFSEQEN